MDRRTRPPRLRRAVRGGVPGGRRAWLAVMSTALALAAVLLLALRDPSGDEAAPPPPTLAVRAVAPEPRTWPSTLPAVGSIAAWQEVVVGAEIGGQRLSRLLVDVGDTVRRGQLLAELGPGPLQAQLDASRAALREAQVMADDAARSAARALELRDSGLMSRQSIDQAVAARDAARARLAAARAQVEADAMRLGYARILAPDDGVVSARAAVEGALVQEGAELLRLQRQGRLEWRAEVPAADLARVAPGQVARIASGTGHLEGRVRQVAPQVDPQTRTGLVYVDLPAGDGVRAGQFARGELLLGTREVLTLPESALLLRDGGSHVFLVEGDTVRQRKVEPGARRGDRVEIRAGLAPGERVVESGVAFLADGVAVRVVGDAAVADAR